MCVFQFGRGKLSFIVVSDSVGYCTLNLHVKAISLLFSFGSYLSFRCVLLYCDKNHNSYIIFYSIANCFIDVLCLLV